MGRNIPSRLCRSEIANCQDMALNECHSIYRHYLFGEVLSCRVSCRKQHWGTPEHRWQPPLLSPTTVIQRLVLNFQVKNIIPCTERTSSTCAPSDKLLWAALKWDPPNLFCLLTLKFTQFQQKKLISHSLVWKDTIYFCRSPAVQHL